MRLVWGLSCCLAAVLFSAGAAVGEEPGGKEAPGPSLEYQPPRPVLPEPKQPTPALPVALFKKSVGGFGIGKGSFNRPVDVVFDKDRNYFVLDAGNNRVQKFDHFDKFLLTWGTYGSRTGEFIDPEALAIDSQGAIFVVDSGNHRIQKFDGQGKFLMSWGSLGTLSGDFKHPRDIAFDGAGNILVVDAGNDRVQKFDPSARFVSELGRSFAIGGGTFEGLVSVAWSDERFGYTYLLSAGCLVQQFDGEGTLIRSFSAAAPESGLCVPARIRSNNDRPNNYLYIVDSGNGLVMRYTREGRYLTALREADRQFAKPLGLGFLASEGEYAVADSDNNVVQKFTLR
jgi:tripartite motif-containing protein 71